MFDKLRLASLHASQSTTQHSLTYYLQSNMIASTTSYYSLHSKILVIAVIAAIALTTVIDVFVVKVLSVDSSSMTWSMMTWNFRESEWDFFVIRVEDRAAGE